MFIKELLFLLIFSSILGNIESAYNCPGYPWIDATNMASPNVNLGCIRFYGTQKMTWIEAENFCRSQNAHLIEILNSEQQSFLAGHANEILEDTAMFNRYEKCSYHLLPILVRSGDFFHLLVLATT